jgi:minor histocompatibility antigen H13
MSTTLTTNRRNLILAYLIFPLTFVLGSLHLLPVYIHMMLVTVAIIYIGSFQSLQTHSQHDERSTAEPLRTRDAAMFPIIGSCLLFGLYCAFKYLPSFWINFVIKCYFFVLGLVVISARFSFLLTTYAAPYLTPNLKEKLTTVAVSFKNPLLSVPFLIEKKETKPEVKAAEEKKSEESSSSASSSSSTSSTTTTKDSKSSTVQNMNSIHADDPIISLTLFDIVAIIGAFVFSVLYILSSIKLSIFAPYHFIFNNLFGICFALQGIEMLSLGSYLNGFILLSGLFFYDIFWVFGTEVMVSVAKSFDAPIKLLFPQASMNAFLTRTFIGSTVSTVWETIGGSQIPTVDMLNPSMLGLGDIVIPGIFIALLLRFDYTRFSNISSTAATASTSSSTSTKKSNKSAHTHFGHPHIHASSSSALPSIPVFPAPYFHFTLFAYFLGLTLTVIIMYVFLHAQPALLYLVPACLGSSLGLAVSRKELLSLWKYSESEEDAETTATKQE